MIAKEILELLRKENPDTILENGWNMEYSYRGYYDQIGLRNAKHMTIGNMIKILERAISGNTYYGWKGGEYTYTEYNSCYLTDSERSLGEEIGPLLLEHMIKDKTVHVESVNCFMYNYNFIKNTIQEMNNVKLSVEGSVWFIEQNKITIQTTNGEYTTLKKS